MPFKSSAQMRAAFGGYLGPEMKSKAATWAKETPNIEKLLDHINNNQMNKKTILKKSVGKYKGKGGPMADALNNTASGVYDGINKVGSDIGSGIGAIGKGIKNGIQNFTVNNPLSAWKSQYNKVMQQQTVDNNNAKHK